MSNRRHNRHSSNPATPGAAQPGGNAPGTRIRIACSPGGMQVTTQVSDLALDPVSLDKLHVSLAKRDGAVVLTLDGGISLHAIKNGKTKASGSIPPGGDDVADPTRRIPGELLKDAGKQGREPQPEKQVNVVVRSTRGEEFTVEITRNAGQVSMHLRFPAGFDQGRVVFRGEDHVQGTRSSRGGHPSTSPISTAAGGAATRPAKGSAESAKAAPASDRRRWIAKPTYPFSLN